MKSTRKSWLGRTAWNLSLTMGITLSLAAGVRAQSPEFDARTGSARINGGNPYQDYRVEQAQFDDASRGFANFPGPNPNNLYGGGFTPPQGVVVDPAFRAAAGLGGPSLQELDQIRFQLYHSNGDINGVDRGFTNIGAFIPRRVFSDYNLFAINPRLLIDNAGNSGFNIGAIHRFYVPDLDRTFGNSFWWDFSRSYGDEVQGVGYSFETIGRYMSFRLNANFRLGESQKVYAQQVLDPALIGNFIALPVIESFEAPLNNVTAEVATPAPYVGKYGVELGLGAYILTGSGVEDTLGVRGRAQWQITEDLWFNTIVSNDNLFDTNVQFNFEYRMPGGLMPSRIARPNPVVMSLVQSVQRDYQVKVARGQRTKYFNEINPKDNEPFLVANINPNANPGGNGSAEAPFASVADYMAANAASRAGFDIILVNARNDGTSTNLDTGIVLTDTQHLYGNGTSPSGFVPTYTSTRGTFFLPGIVAGARPTLSNAGAPGNTVVTLAGNATEVSNLIINGTNTGNGIASSGAIDGFNIHDNTIQNTLFGIQITSNTSAALNCPGEDVGIIADNTISGNVGGVQLNHVGGNLDLLMARNTITGGTTDSAQINVDNSTLSGSIDGNSFLNSPDNGLELNLTNAGSVNLSVTNNEFSGNSNNGFQANALDGTNTLTNLLLTGNTFGGVSVNGRNGFGYTANGGDANLLIGGPDPADGNNFAGNLERGIDINLFAAALAATDIRNNTITLASAGGNIFLTGHDVLLHQGQNDFDTTILNFLRGGTPAAQYDLVVLGSGLGGAFGWNFTNGTQTLPGFSSVNFVDTDNLIANPALWDTVFAADGVVILSHTTVGGGDLDTPGSNAINSQSARFATFISSGGDVWANAGATLPTYYNFLPAGAVATGATIAGSTGFAPTAAGLAIGITDVAPTSMINGFPTHNSFPTFDPAFTVFEERVADDTGTPVVPPQSISLGIQGALISAGGFVTSGLDGIRIRTSDTAQLRPSFIRDNTITGYGQNAINVLSSNTSIVRDLSILDNVFARNGNSIHINRMDSADINTLVVRRNSQTGATLNGLFIETTGTAAPTTNVVLSDNSFLNSDDSGLRIETRGPTVVNLTSDRDHFDTGTDGLTADLFDTSVQNLTFRNSTFDNNDDSGQTITAINNTQLTYSFTSPADPLASFGGSVSGNTNFGAHLIGSENAILNVLVTGSAFNGNGDANLGIELSDNATVPTTMLIQGNTFNAALDAANVDFFGDGVSLRASGFASYRDVRIDGNTADGNAGDGFRVDITQFAQFHAAGNPLAGGLLMTGNTATNNLNGIAIFRDADAVLFGLIGDVTNPALGNSSFTNTNHGLLVETRGSNLGVAPAFTPLLGVNLTVANNLFQANAVDNVHVDMFDLSTANVSLICNTIDGAGVSEDGVEISTNNGAIFAANPATFVPVLFDGNSVFDHTDSGYEFNLNTIAALNNTSQQHVNIFGTSKLARIERNANGVVINHSNSGVSRITIGNVASINPATTLGADVPPDRPDVLIANNTVDGIQHNHTATGTAALTVFNTLAFGNRTLGGASRHGLNSLITQISGTTNINVFNSTFTDFGDDGMHFFYDSANNRASGVLNPVFNAAAINVNVVNTVTGQSAFSRNVGDGVDIELWDSTFAGGANFAFINHQSYNNGGDGLRFTTFAENISGSRPIVLPDIDNSNPADQTETTSNQNPGLLLRPDYFTDTNATLQPAGPNPFINNDAAVYGDVNAIDVVANLTIIDSDYRFNGDDGLDLAIGAATLQNVNVLGSAFFANAVTDVRTHTITNEVATKQDSINRGDVAPPGNRNDEVALDPLAHLYLNFGTSSTTSPPLAPTLAASLASVQAFIAASPTPIPVSGVFANSGNQISPIGYRTGGGLSGVFTNNDAIRGNNRVIGINFNVFTNPTNFFSISGSALTTFSTYNGRSNLADNDQDTITGVVPTVGGANPERPPETGSVFVP